MTTGPKPRFLVRSVATRQSPSRLRAQLDGDCRVASLLACVDGPSDARGKMRILTGGSIAIMCPACWRGNMAAGPDGFRDPAPNNEAALKAVAGTGSLDHRFDRSSSHSALSSRHRRALPAAGGDDRRALVRVIVTRAVWAISVFNHGRSRAAVGSPEARRDRVRRSHARPRRSHCRVDCRATLPARRHIRPGVRRAAAMVSFQRWTRPRRSSGRRMRMTGAPSRAAR